MRSDTGRMIRLILVECSGCNRNTRKQELSICLICLGNKRPISERFLTFLFMRLCVTLKTTSRI